MIDRVDGHADSALRRWICAQARTPRSEALGQCEALPPPEPTRDAAETRAAIPSSRDRECGVWLAVW